MGTKRRGEQTQRTKNAAILKTRNAAILIPHLNIIVLQKGKKVTKNKKEDTEK